MNKTENPSIEHSSSLVMPLKGVDQIVLPSSNEEPWIEVIYQMDKVYSELVESQAALEEKNAELEEAQEFIAGVMSAMSDLMIVCDKKGKIQQVNNALESLTGKPSVSFVGRLLTDILTSKVEDEQARFVAHLRENKSFSDYEVLVQGAQDEEVPLSVNCSPRHDPKGRLIGLVLIGRPVGELQRANCELDAALQKFEKAQLYLVGSEKMSALGRLVAGVAHELNNPISFVFGNMYALKNYGKKITRYLKAIDSTQSHEEVFRLRDELQIDRIAIDILPLVEGTLEGAERISDIVQDLRRFSGNQKESMEEFQLRPVIQTAVNWVLRGAKNSPEVQLDCHADVQIFSKKGYLHQILVNLIQNALDALLETREPHVNVSVKMKDESIQVIVRDNGPGISEANSTQIFEPFFTTKSIGQGTGLGLYVSYRMAEELGAELTVENNPAKEGAVFTLDLPSTPPGADL